MPAETRNRRPALWEGGEESRAGERAPAPTGSKQSLGLNEEPSSSENPGTVCCASGCMHTAGLRRGSRPETEKSNSRDRVGTRKDTAPTRGLPFLGRQGLIQPEAREWHPGGHGAAPPLSPPRTSNRSCSGSTCHVPCPRRQRAMTPALGSATWPKDPLGFSRSGSRRLHFCRLLSPGAGRFASSQTPPAARLGHTGHRKARAPSPRGPRVDVTPQEPRAVYCPHTVSEGRCVDTVFLWGFPEFASLRRVLLNAVFRGKCLCAESLRVSWERARLAAVCTSRLT